MSLYLVVLLAVIQGVTEFLPVSSSGHLVVSRSVLEPYLGRIESPLALDILLHLATALVTVFFLRRELLQILLRMGSREGTRERRLVVLLVCATIPAVLVGFLFKDTIESLFASAAWAFNGFLMTAVLLELAHRNQVKLGNKSVVSGTLDWLFPSVPQAILIGCAQAMAILPGVSRSGSTIAVALLLGLPPQTAVLFSFFMLLPVVAGATILEIPELRELNYSLGYEYALGFCCTLLTAYIALRFLVWIVQGAKLRWFAIYTFLLGTLGRFLLG